MKRFNKSVIASLMVCVFGVYLNAEEIPGVVKRHYMRNDVAVGAEAYFLGANGWNVNLRYFPLDWLYIKGAYGSEELDVWEGSVEYDYTSAAFGAATAGYDLFTLFLEVYYRMPMNEKISGFYETSVDSYVGVNIGMGVFLSDNWTLDFTLGFFSAPKLTERGYNEEEDIAPFTAGISATYFFR
ncbi:MAG: hypothetical protein LBQ52_00905 [Helicobacteraceae bacterium]|jgi:hypothetical protein|nr:hypothetical protein [Helicobacteraceae bacterium]